jgi:mono/diheme cytochrome c family protein
VKSEKLKVKSNAAQSVGFLFVVALVAVSVSGCFTDKRKPGWEYMPDMAHSQAYDAYSPNPNFNNGMTSRVPVKGTIPLYQGTMGNASNYALYPYTNDSAGYAQAGANLKNPLAATPQALQEGERLFTIYCSPCHGPGGKGNGSIVVNDQLKHPFPPPPSYYEPRLLALPEGQMFHTVRFGKNLMGSYASQVDQKEAWMIIHYIKTMQSHYIDSLKTAGGYPTASRADSLASANAGPVSNQAGTQTQSTPNTNNKGNVVPQTR